MDTIRLRCVNCGKQYPLGLYYRCDLCDFPLEVISQPLLVGDSYESIDQPGIWRYHSLLPQIESKMRVSLGEGNTPLIHLSRLGSDLGLSELYLKNEGQNPTGSFKDRPTAVSMSVAKSLGINTVIVSSTGNAGASLAAYAARAGIRAIVLVSGSTPPAKLVQMSIHGATIVPINGNLSEAFWLAYKAALQWGWMDLTSTFLCPYGVEGDKTVAYELYSQLGKAPDWVIIPVSVGPLAVGIYKGFADLKIMGLVDKIPRIVAAQTAACAPIARAYIKGETDVRAWLDPVNTVAGGIADPLNGYEKDGTYTLRVVRTSSGAVTESTDLEIIQAVKLLAKKEGCFCEPTGCVSIAALPQLELLPSFSPKDIIVCIATGHGLKQVRAFEEEVKLPLPIVPSLEALEKLVEMDGVEK